MVGLGLLPDSISSTATDVSGDGSIVVGSVLIDNQGEPYTVAFIWDAAHGMRDLKAALTDLGLGPAVDAWTLDTANAISDDGLTIAGTGDYGLFGWVAVIPEPGTGILFVTGLLGLAGWRRVYA